MNAIRPALVALAVALAALPGCSAIEEAAQRIGLMDDDAPRTVPVPKPVEGWDSIGSSVRGKPILATTVGDGPRRIYIIGGVHGDEPEGQETARVLPDLLRRADPDSLKGATIRILMDMNPDGTLARTRTNTRGVDLNRNWPASNYRAGARHGDRALSELETVAVHTDITRFDPDLVMVFHSSYRGPFVNYDGAETALAQRFAAAARDHDPRWRVVHEMGYPTPGSLGSYVGVDQKTPILTVEFQRGREVETNAPAVLAGVMAVLKK